MMSTTSMTSTPDLDRALSWQRTARRHALYAILVCCLAAAQPGWGHMLGVGGW